MSYEDDAYIHVKMTNPLEQGLKHGAGWSRSCSLRVKMTNPLVMKHVMKDRGKEPLLSQKYGATKQTLKYFVLNHIMKWLSWLKSQLHY